MPDQTLRTSSEKELIVSANQGNTSALSELYTRYFQKVVSRCLALVKNRDTAHDLAQDVLLKALEKLSSFHVQASFSTWLYAIATNHCLEYLRREKIHPLLPLEEGLYVSNDAPEQDTQPGIDLLEKKMNRMLEHLSEEERNLLISKYCEGKSIQELQEVHQLSGSAVKMRLKRAKHKLALLFAQPSGR
jgi:RNA polymerase sigma factor (sigma-70 family)